MNKTFTLLCIFSLSHIVITNKVEPRWTTSVETKATSRNEMNDRQSASETNVNGLQEDSHARSIAKGDRNTLSKSFGDTHSQSNLDFADAKSDAEQDGVGTTLANSELTTKYLKEDEEILPEQGDDLIKFERAGGFPTEASLGDFTKADNRVYRNSGSSSLGKKVRSSGSIAGSTMLNLQTITSENNSHGEKASTLSAGLGFSEGRRNQTGSFDNALSNGNNASVTNQSAMHSNSRAAKSETQSVANAERVDGVADTASKTQAVNIGEGSAFGNAITRNDLNVSSTLTNAKSYRSNYDVVKSP